MSQFAEHEDTLSIAEAAEHFGVDKATVARWYIEGNLPAIRIGDSWRVRRSALELFLESRERPKTLEGQLYAFLRVPDNLLVVAQTPDLSHHIDAAFFKVAEARDGILVKYHSEGPGRTSLDELRADLERKGFGVSRLEGEGRLLMLSLGDPEGGRREQLERLVEEHAE
jgi:excisionase family DNA binding protein